MTNTKVPAQLIVDAAEAVRSGVQVRRSYSGRGMYGATCFGLVFEDGASAAFEFFAALGELVGEQQEYDEPEVEQGFAQDLARAASTDSMGLGTIVYFRRFEIDGDLPSWLDEDGDEDY